MIYQLLRGINTSCIKIIEKGIRKAVDSYDILYGTSRDHLSSIETVDTPYFRPCTHIIFISLEAKLLYEHFRPTLTQTAIQFNRNVTVSYKSRYNKTI